MQTWPVAAFIWKNTGKPINHGIATVKAKI
jgi:hypothetical protein